MSPFGTFPTRQLSAQKSAHRARADVREAEGDYRIWPMPLKKCSWSSPSC